MPLNCSAVSQVCWGILSSLHLHINRFNIKTFTFTWICHKCIRYPFGNYKLLMTHWIISQATNLYRHSAYVKEGCLLSFFLRKETLIIFAVSVWTLPIFTNLPFQVSNLWLGYFQKQSWFYCKSLTALITPKLIPHVFIQIICVLALM